jgi:predicted ATPase
LISVTNEQLYILVGVPMLFNATLIGLVIAYINAKIGKVESRFDAVDARFDAVDARFESVNVRFDAVDRRFDDMRDLWRAELRRVEEVLDARLKHIEERG